VIQAGSPISARTNTRAGQAIWRTRPYPSSAYRSSFRTPRPMLWRQPGPRRREQHRRRLHCLSQSGTKVAHSVQRRRQAQPSV